MYMEIRLKELCQKKGTTQKDLALKLGVTEMTLSRAAKGNTSLPLLERIATALNIPVSELFEAPKEGEITCPKCGNRITIKAE